MRLRILLRCCFALLSLLFSLAANGDSRTLLVIGDTGECDLPGAEEVSAALRRQPDWRAAWLLELGDLAYPTATLERLLECHEPYFRSFEHRLAVPGNHDWHDAGGRGFFGLFPDPVPRAEMLNDRWTLLLLNSNLRAEAWDAQLRWLDDAVKSTADRCVIAAWHHPRWSSGHRAGSRFTDPLWQRVAGRAALTLHGHDHHYESLPPLDGKGADAPDGTRSFIVGNGGAELYRPGEAVLPGSTVVFGHWGFLRIDLAGDEYRWRAFDVDGDVIDSGTGRCQPVAAPARQ